ncbi:MAG: aminopeptidase P family N-terminal domain-containing protein, partial [Candidatus Margulisiibacteriota bacterium]
MQSPISRLLNSLSSLNLDAMLVSDPANISYLTGLRSRDAWLLVSRKESFYLTDARYTEEAALGLHGITLRKIKKPLFEELALIAQSKRLAKIGFEEHRVTWLFHKKLQEKLKNSRS